MLKLVFAVLLPIGQLCSIIYLFDHFQQFSHAKNPVSI